MRGLIAPWVLSRRGGDVSASGMNGVRALRDVHMTNRSGVCNVQQIR